MSCEIDGKALERVLRMGGETLLERLVEAALGNLATRSGELERALGSGDAAAAERAAHSIKSSARNLGATALGELAEAAEELARQTQSDADGGATEGGWREAAGRLLGADLVALRAEVTAAAAAAAAKNRGEG